MTEHVNIESQSDEAEAFYTRKQRIKRALPWWSFAAFVFLMSCLDFKEIAPNSEVVISYFLISLIVSAPGWFIFFQKRKYASGDLNQFKGKPYFSAHPSIVSQKADSSGDFKYFIDKLLGFIFGLSIVVFWGLVFAGFIYILSGIPISAAIIIAALIIVLFR
jgi:hypothetical protein